VIRMERYHGHHMQVRLELREETSVSRKHLPAAVLVSIGCSVAFNEAPLALTDRTMS
jgi:hypothetical protein